MRLMFSSLAAKHKVSIVKDLKYQRRILTFNNFQAVQRDLGEELVLVGVQGGGHGARADAAVGLANGAASFLDAGEDEQIVEQEEATILARPLSRWHGHQVEEQELPLGGYKIGDALDDAL